jgi:hypothetical protein
LPLSGFDSELLPSALASALADLDLAGALDSVFGSALDALASTAGFAARARVVFAGAADSVGLVSGADASATTRRLLRTGLVVSWISSMFIDCSFLGFSDSIFLRFSLSGAG